jgi:cytochrome c peroxidase
MLACAVLMSGAVHGAAPRQTTATGDATTADEAISGGEVAVTPVMRRETTFDWHLPRGFPTPAVPADNPMSEVKVALGRHLFFESKLSVTGSYSCASCHEPAHAFSDGRPVAIGATGQALPHNAMALVNVAYNISYGWTEPQLQSLEAQMLKPLLNEHPVELGMAGRAQSVGFELSQDQGYRDAFAQSFPEDAVPVSLDNVIKAIAAFERTLISGHSPFDRYVFGAEHDAISAQAKRGMALFYSARAGCGSCHSGFNFDGNWRDAQGETGKASFANNGTSGQLMRVPTLRNIALSAPYMHDGRFPDLETVLQHYAQVAKSLREGHKLGTVGVARGDVADAAKLRSFDLNEEERSDLVAFLNTLTDEEFSSRYAGR